ncbi:hypothetical protein HBO40_00345 [Pseudomonas protegens]|uniref:hypothetical protein n=1 Tax=Pseudomonas TaxID=286 RepID=UPI00147514C7|nr:hypothetical protein [Pseudomonas sp. JV245A]MDT9644037.1 hypothetical protein [Pseudomonas sp. JV245A]NMZ26050.1 hypothetical protein [Pseudomonas protegens]NMZ84629.1 hypothetical protein [Pseudomonas protegens]
MPDEPFSLDQLYSAIERHIRDAIPGLAYVATMPDLLKESVAIPAVVIELVELEPGQDQLVGETALEARFEARVIVGAEQEQPQQQAAFAASQIAVLLRMQTWGVGVDPAVFVRAAQDWTRPELDTYAVWVVEWTQGFYLGTEEWPWPDQLPGVLELSLGEDAPGVRVEVQP